MTETKALSQFPPSPSPLALTLADARSREGEAVSQFHSERGVGVRARAEHGFERRQLAIPLETKGCPTTFNLKMAECHKYTATALCCIHKKL